MPNIPMPNNREYAASTFRTELRCLKIILDRIEHESKAIDQQSVEARAFVAEAMAEAQARLAAVAHRVTGKDAASLMHLGYDGATHRIRPEVRNAYATEAARKLSGPINTYTGTDRRHRMEKLRRMAKLLGHSTPEALLSSYAVAATLPGMCVNKSCDYLIEDAEPEAWNISCDRCGTMTVQSIKELAGLHYLPWPARPEDGA